MSKTQIKALENRIEEILHKARNSPVDERISLMDRARGLSQDYHKLTGRYYRTKRKATGYNSSGGIVWT